MDFAMEAGDSHMKVLDLECAVGHRFEGWFASEGEAVVQLERKEVLCPVCGSSSIVRRLSAPRLNLGHHASTPPPSTATIHKNQDKLPEQNLPMSPAMLTAVYERMVQQVLTHTTDVGTEFARQARDMHEGHRKPEAIRGQATAQEVRELREDGIKVLALPVPESSKQSLQ